MNEEEKSGHFSSSLSNALWQAIWVYEEKSRWTWGRHWQVFTWGREEVTSPWLEKCEEGAEDVVSGAWGLRPLWRLDCS